MNANVIRRSVVEPAFDGGPTPKRIGLILLATDGTSERDFGRMTPAAEAAIFSARLAYENPTTPENLRRMQPRLAETARLILPGERLDAICYCCTAASMVLGDDAVAAAVREGKPGVPVVTPALAGRIGLEAVGARRISVLTPYLPETSASVVSYFARHGFEVLNLDCFGLDDDRRMARVTPDAIVAAADRAVAPEAEALFISCTALRAAEVAGEIEARIGRPVVTSNQASVWLTLRYAGIVQPIEGYGRLMLFPMPDEVPVPSPVA